VVPVLLLFLTGSNLACSRSGLSDPSNPSPHKRYTIVLIPPSAKGVTIVRPMQVFGYDDAPEGHCEVVYDNVVVREEDCLVGGWGRGFEVSSRVNDKSEKQ
jgi:acyl-CoA dehydrogenase